MLIDPCFKISIFNSLVESDQDSCIWDNFLEVMNDLVLLDDGDGAEAVIKVWEKVWNRVRVFEPGEDDWPIERIVKAI